MSIFYTFIATRTTYERVIPNNTGTQGEFNRKVSQAFRDFTGGTVRVGQLAYFPLPTAVSNHLLCDGSELDQAGFPELFKYLGDTQGVAAAGKFKLPNYIGASTPATTAPEQVVTGSTVSTGGTVTTPTQPGQTGGSSGGGVPTGGRYGGKQFAE